MGHATISYLTPHQMTMGAIECLAFAAIVIAAAVKLFRSF